MRTTQADLDAIIAAKDLTRPQKVEVLLENLHGVKIVSAVAGAFSLTKLGFGLFFNTIPRVVRAHEAEALKNLFKAARCVAVSGQNAAPEQLAKLEAFVAYVRHRSAKHLARYTAHMSKPGISELDRVVLLSQRAHHAVLMGDEFNAIRVAKLLTAANILMPKGLSQANIVEYGRVLEPSMRDGMMQSGYIKKLDQYVADLIAQPKVDFLFSFSGAAAPESMQASRLEDNINERLKTLAEEFVLRASVATSATSTVPVAR